MRVVVAVGLSILAVSSKGATQTTAFELSRGGKEYVCADLVQEAATPAPVQSWVMGFWTGLNYGMAWNVGKTTTASGIMGEVRLLCQQNPSDKLYDASLAAYRKLKTAGK